MFENVLQNLHEVSAKAVSFSGDYPEATVGVWILSGLLMLIQVFFLTKRMFGGSKAVNTINKVQYVRETQEVPYIPPESIQKMVKLLKNQSSGWEVDQDENGNSMLVYGDVEFVNQGGLICVNHDDVPIDLTAYKSNFEFDNSLLLNAFVHRVNNERIKARNISVKRHQDNINRAKTHFNTILDTI